MTFPPARLLEGVASDGVATVESLDADGTVLDSTPVVATCSRRTSKEPGDGRRLLETLDAKGNVLSKQKLPGR